MIDDVIEMPFADEYAHFKGALYLNLKVCHVLFNQKGKYILKFSIAGSRGDLRKVRLFLGDSNQSIFEHEYTSEPCYQNGLDNPCLLGDNQFRFEMPEGEYDTELTHSPPERLKMQFVREGLRGGMSLRHALV